MYKKRWLKTSQPCPCGKSSDSFATDVDGNGFCFRGDCRKFFKDNKEVQLTKEEQEEKEESFEGYVSYDYYPHRGISRKTMEFFDVKTKFVNDIPQECRFDFPNKAAQIKNINPDHQGSKYRTIGEYGQAGLYGLDKFDSGSKDSITIVEGFHDCLAAYEMLHGQSAVVSVKSSSSGMKEIIRDRDKINSFKKIILAIENDESGQNLIRQITSSGIFDFNKLFIVKLDKYKDANEYLINQAVDDFKKAWSNARKYTPDNIISTFAEIEKSLNQSKEDKIAEYPFKHLNDNLYGLHKGEVVVIKAPEGVGKQLPNTTPIPTPDGWTTMGDIKTGDIIFGADGNPTEVIGITETQYNVPCYEIVFADGTRQIAGGPHKWGVYHSSSGEYLVKTTEEIYNEGPLRNNNVSRYSIAINKPLQLPEKELPIDPYLLGLWLGDGHSYSANITVGASDLEEFTNQVVQRNSILSFIKRYKTAFSVRLDKLTYRQLRENNLIKNKHIPVEYLRASEEQRKELLRGLMDSDGGVERRACVFYSSNKTLFDGVVELLRTLGHKLYISQKQSKLYGVDKKIAYRAWFLPSVATDIFSYRRKIEKIIPCKTARRNTKTIRQIIPVESVPSRCLSVANEDHLYLCGEAFTVTHNTEFFRAIEHHILKTTNHKLGIIHLEEDNATTVKAIAGYELEVPAILPDCGLSVEDILAGYKKAVRDDEGRVHIYSSFEVEDEEIFLDNVRFLVSVAGCSIITLDHISWLATGREDEDERKKLDRLSQKLKLLAKELGFCLIEIAHVNDDGKTRGSRNISKVANTVISISRDLTSPDIATRNTMEFMIEKARLGGKTGPAGRAVFNQMTGKLEDAYKPIS